MKFNKVILCLILAVTFSSCCHKSSKPKAFNIIPPSAETYSWFQIPEGDRVSKNQDNVYDTLFVDVTDTLLGTNSLFPTNEKKYRSCEEVDLPAYLELYIRQKTNSHGFYARLSSASHEMYHTNKYLFRASTSTQHLYLSKETLIPINVTWITVNGIAYEVSVINDLADTDSMPFFQSIYYSKTQGIVRYITVNGDSWELVN